MRTSIRAQRDRLAVEDQRLRARAAHRGDDFRHARRDVVQVARIDAHLVRGLVHLDARAIELPLDQRSAERGKRSLHVLGRLGKHRQHRLHHAHRELRERRGAAAERSCGDRRDGAGEGDRTAHLSRRQLRCGGDGFHHDSFERTLAQLTDDQPHQKILLVCRGSLEQLAQERSAPLGGAFTLHALELLESRVDIA